MLLRTLEALGFEEPKDASSADEARELLRSGVEVDLVLSDIRMEGTIDGYGLAHWLRKERPATRVLLMTGYTDHDITDFVVLSKPYSMSVLEETLTKLLS